MFCLNEQNHRIINNRSNNNYRQYMSEYKHNKSESKQNFQYKLQAKIYKIQMRMQGGTV